MDKNQKIIKSSITIILSVLFSVLIVFSVVGGASYIKQNALRVEGDATIDKNVEVKGTATIYGETAINASNVGKVALRVLGAGKVGIGEKFRETLPAYPLDVDGSIHSNGLSVDVATSVAYQDFKAYLPIEVNGQQFYLPLYGSPSVPATPTRLSATDLSSGSQVAPEVYLRWIDNADNESFYVVERSNTSDQSGFGQIAQLGADSFDYYDWFVSPGVQYWYRVKACNGAGCSSYSNVVNITVGSGQSSPPSSGGTITPPDIKQ